MKRIAFTLLLCLAAVPAWAGQGARAMIEDFFCDLDTLSADFTQTVTDDQGQVMEESGGRVYLELPDHFRWDYDKPYEQIIVADGEKVWLYDVGLEQITVRDQQKAAKDSPLLVLANTDLLDKYFETRDLGKQGDNYWLEMTPKKPESEYESVEAAVNEQGLHGLVFKDRFGQQTVLIFKNLEVNKSLDDDLFTFTPPEGVDVIGDVPGTQSK